MKCSFNYFEILNLFIDFKLDEIKSLTIHLLLDIFSLSISSILR